MWILILFLGLEYLRESKTSSYGPTCHRSNHSDLPTKKVPTTTPSSSKPPFSRTLLKQPKYKPPTHSYITDPQKCLTLSREHTSFPTTSPSPAQSHLTPPFRQLWNSHPASNFRLTWARSPTKRRRPSRPFHRTLQTLGTRL